MLSSNKTFNFGVVLGFVSLFLIGFAALGVMKAKEEIIQSFESIKIDPQVIKTNVRPSTDQQITNARRSIQVASNRIRSLKINIFNHANTARTRRSLAEADRILIDIADNAQKVAEAHQNLETQFFDLVELYNRKIEEIYRAQSSRKSKSNYGISFWAGIIGIISAISAMVLAWRKDHREKRELELEIEKLQSKIVT